MKKYYYLLLSILLFAVVVFAVDTTSPAWQNQSQNISLTKTPNNTFSIQLKDDVALDSAFLSTNESGSFQNSSTIYKYYVTIDNQSRSSWNETFSGNENKIIWIKTVGGINLTSAMLNVSGYDYLIGKRLNFSSYNLQIRKINESNTTEFEIHVYDSSGDGSAYGKINITSPQNITIFNKTYGNLGTPAVGEVNETIIISNTSFYIYLEVRDSNNGCILFGRTAYCDNWYYNGAANVNKTIFYDSIFELNNSYIDTASSGSPYEWNYTGEFNSTVGSQQVNLNTTLINNYCSNSSNIAADGTCTFPVTLHSDTAGIIQISNITLSTNATNWANFTWSNSSITDQTIGWKIWFNDTSNNINSTNIMTFIVDSVNPSLLLFSPTNSTYNSINTSTRILNYTSIDTNLDTVLYSYNGTNTTLSGNTTFTSLEGQSTLTIYTNDSAGNINSTSVTFTVDATPPTYTQLAVNSTNIRKNDTLKFSALWNDLFAGLSKFIFSWNVTGTFVNTTYDFSANWSNTTLNMTANRTQEIHWLIYANDSFGNMNQTIMGNFTVQNSQPVVTSVSISPSPTDGSSDLNCSGVYFDLDGDTENQTWFRWFKNDVLLSATTQNLTNSNFSQGDNIICSIKAYDGTDNSTWINSSQLTINDAVAPAYNSITFSATSGTVNTAMTVTVNLTEANGMSWSKMEVEDPNQQLSNLTMSDSRIGSIYTYSVSYTPIIAGTYLFKFYAMDGSGNAANYTSSVSYTALTAQQQQTGGGGGITIVTQCGNRICEINENSASCPTDCAAKFTLLEPQFDRELKQITIKGGLFGGNIYEFRIKNLQDTDLNVTFRTGTVWLKFDIGGIERSEFTSKLNRKGATDSGMGYIRLVAHLVGNSSNATLGEITATDGYTTASIPVLFAASESPDYSKYATLPNIGLSLMLLIGFVFFAKKN